MRMLLVVGLIAVFGCAKKESTGALGDPESRLKGVPAQAFFVGVIELSEPPFKQLGMFMDEAAAKEMIADLDAHLKKQLGISVASVRTATVFGSPETGAALIPGIEGTLTGTSAGEHMGTKLLTVFDDFVAAQLDGMLVIGKKESVIAALDVLADRAPPLTRAKPEMAKLFAREAKGAILAVLANGTMLGMVLREEGLDAGVLSVRANGIRAVLTGRAPALGSIATKIRAGVAMLGKELADAPPETAVLEHAAFLVGRHHFKYLERILAPQVTGEVLTIDVPVRGEEIFAAYSFTAAVGMLSAVAIPAFMKNASKAKTTEATSNVKRLFDGARAYREEKQAFPGGSAGPVPPLGACCAQPGKKCQPDPKLWQSAPWTDLQFSVEDPHYFSYSYVTDGTSFTVAAHGDLDCDGIYSTFEMVGTIAEEGSVTGGAGFFKDNDLE